MLKFNQAFNSDSLGISVPELTLKITKVIVDEEGTEASAATAVLIQKTSFLKDEVKVNINKPFIYILRNNENNSIYFMGRIKNPNLY